MHGEINLGYSDDRMEQSDDQNDRSVVVDDEDENNNNNHHGGIIERRFSSLGFGYVPSIRPNSPNATTSYIVKSSKSPH